ncbi:MAG TPA: acyl-CoA dehydrogenase N-terminal domain-containing protein, partial [Pseudoxanthomonas sp.]|nr:acyl-CoA dehydrogenase N-terminal domain-containing protein [Pseudoxanthomonas sp.]
MSTYRAPLSDIRFALYDVLGVEALFARLGQTEATRDVLDAVLDEAARFTETVLAPLNSVGDEIGCKLDTATHQVTTPPGFKAAYDQFIEGGWTGLTASPDFGGQGLP